jgi:hypothetical protein
MTLNGWELVILSHRQWLIVNSRGFLALLDQNVREEDSRFWVYRTDLASSLRDASFRVYAFRDPTSATIC